MALRVRKNHLRMSAAEKRRFVEAVLALKANGAYDRLVKEHRSAMPSMSGSMSGMPMGPMAHMAHRNPWFLPWHREFLARYEAELRKVDAKVTLPYWNWFEDRAKSSPLWSGDFMGGSGRGPKDHVADGPFAYEAGDWRLTVLSDGVHDPALRRTIGRDERLPTKANVLRALKRTPYDTEPWEDEARSQPGSGFRPELEHRVHDPVHMWVGGTMELATSPNDPVFFLHHANVDRLWAVWRHEHKAEEPYLPVNAGTRFDADAKMPAFGTKPDAVLDHHALGYRYDVEDAP
jgi:tyrosinase